MTLTPDTLCTYMKRYPAFAFDVVKLLIVSQQLAKGPQNFMTEAILIKSAARVGTALELADELERSV